MQISAIFNLQKTQAELDFVDVDISQDTALFLDPFFLGNRKDNWSIEASRTLRSFVQTVIDLIVDNRKKEAKQLFSYLHEPNSTCLGLSKGKPKGRGVGKSNADDIFDNIMQSRAIHTGLIQDLEDNYLFVDNFGKDKLSDMTTNIIRQHLIEYTIAQAELHDISLNDSVPSGYYWNRDNRQWEAEYTKMLVIKGRVILLVPKGIVSFSDGYTPEKYYQHFVLNFLQNEHLSLNSALVQQRKSGVKYVTKKSIQEGSPYSKEFLRNFTKRNPKVLEDFKKTVEIKPFTNDELSPKSLIDIANHLIDNLLKIPSGNENASNYHKLIVGILELLFYPSLIYPSLEQKIHEGRKRIDITFDNAATSGIFRRFSDNMNLPCQFIYIECKNYTADISNQEIDQLSGRFSTNRGKVGFILCRSVSNNDLLINRCRDTYRDSRGLIIPLSDTDIITLLKNVHNWNSAFLDSYISNRVRQITLN